MLYIFDRGEQRGPYSLEELQSMWDGGQLSQDALLWDEGTSAWLGLAESLGLAVPAESDTLASGDPPPLSEKSIAGRSGRTFKAAGSIPRFFAFVVDYSLLSWLAIKIPEKAGLAVSAQEVLTTFILLFGIALRDVAWGGRSLGRRLTLTYLVDRQSLAVPSAWTSIRRNLAEIFCMIGPLLIILLFSLLIPDGVGGIIVKTLSIAALGGMMAVVRSAENPTGQGYWDQFWDTAVVNSAGKSGRPISRAPHGSQQNS